MRTEGYASFGVSPSCFYLAGLDRDGSRPHRRRLMTGSGLASCASYWQNSDAPASRERSSISSLRGNRAFTPVFDGLWRRSNPEPCRSLDCFAALAMTSVLPPLPATRGGKKNGDTDMPSPHNKRSDERKFLKRRSAEQGLAEVDAAHLATHRLYCETLKFWRRCGLVTCHRHRRCLGEPTGCLMRGLPFVPPAERLRAQDQVIAGGPRRLPPATHVEWCLRRTELATVISWGFAQAPSAHAQPAP
jgi:hypothetical protein